MFQCDFDFLTFCVSDQWNVTSEQSEKVTNMEIRHLECTINDWHCRILLRLQADGKMDKCRIFDAVQQLKYEGT